MKKFLSFLLFLILIAGFSIDLCAQKKTKRLYKRFGFGVLAGISATQIDGDNYTGFDKAGLQYGIRGIAYLNPKFQINTEINYLKKGSRFETAVIVSDIKNRLIDLTYVEAPILMRYRPNVEKPFFMEIGAAIASLSNTFIEENITKPELEVSYEALQADFKSIEFSYLMGMGWEINKNIGFQVRYAIGLSPFYIAPETEQITEPVANFLRGEEVSSLRNYSISLLLSYSFIDPYKKKKRR